MKRTMLVQAGIALAFFMLFAQPTWAAAGWGGEDSSKSDTFKEGVKAINSQDYRAAIEWMTKAVAETPKDADAYNLLGYAHRKLGDYPNALKFYALALELDPEHRGAHEYLGEAFLELNQPEEARKHLAALDKICWLGCQEYRDLKRAIAKYEQASK